MTAIKDVFYKIKIILTNNEDSKEFIIDKMKQIQLEDYSRIDAQISDTISQSENKDIFMLREPYYINNDILQKIKETAKASNTNDLFPKLGGNKLAPAKFAEFYEIILNCEDKLAGLTTLKFILEKITIDFKKEYQNQLNKRDRDMAMTKLPAQDLYTKLMNLITIEEPDIQNIITAINSAIETSKGNKEAIIIPPELYEKLKGMEDLITDSDIISNLKSIYTNPHAIRYNSYKEAAIEFKNNINAIFSKNNVDGGNEFIKLNKYEYFLDKPSIRYIFNIIETNNKSTRPEQQLQFTRQENSLNSKDSKKQILTENFKYVFPNKTSIDQLGSGEEELIILFYNIVYIIKKIYLLDTTIIDVDKAKFFVKNLTLDKLNPFRRDAISGNDYLATIRFNVDLTYINEIPILRINYIIDDLESNNTFKATAFEAKNFSKNQKYDKYKSIYIYDDINYNRYKNNITNFFNTIKIQNIIKSKEELFYNEIVLNKMETLHKEFLSNETDKKQPKKQTNDPEIITSNIIYFLKDILKLYDGKEFTYNNDSYFIYDTLITKNFNKLGDSADKPADKPAEENSVPFYSISQKKTHIHSNLKTHKIVKNLKLKQRSLGTDLSDVSVDFNIFFSDSPDKRIKARVYYIFIVLLCYKADENGKKPNIKDRVIAENCLQRANVLDKSFSTLFYNKFKISEHFLFNKLSNLTRSKKVKPPSIDASKGDTSKGDASKGDASKLAIPPAIRNVDIAVRGGKGRKYRTRKNTKALYLTNNTI